MSTHIFQKCQRDSDIHRDLHKLPAVDARGDGALYERHLFPDKPGKCLIPGITGCPSFIKDILHRKIAGDDKDAFEVI